MNTAYRDQAETLRVIARQRDASPSAPQAASAEWQRPLAVAVASGKGGVGKTNIVANLAIAFAQRGARVLAVDGDLGLANLDIAFGISPRGSLIDVLAGECELESVLTPGPEGVWMLPACSGRYDLANISEHERYAILSAIDGLESRFDALVIDTGAGINSNAITFASSAQHVIVVANSEPTSLADAYAFIKVMVQRCALKRVQLVANSVRRPGEGEEIHAKLCAVAERFFDVAIDYLGAIPRDAAIPRSIQASVPVLLGAPSSPAARAIDHIAERLIALREQEAGAAGVQLFWKRLLGWSATP